MDRRVSGSDGSENVRDDERMKNERMRERNIPAPVCETRGIEKEKKGRCTIDIFEVTGKIRGVVDRVFRAPGGCRSPKKKNALPSCVASLL